MIVESDATIDWKHTITFFCQLKLFILLHKELQYSTVILWKNLNVNKCLVTEAEQLTPQYVEHCEQEVAFLDEQQQATEPCIPPKSPKQSELVTGDKDICIAVLM
jgi:hypothetical protein